jgi:ribulose-phosphate 3-epimerase
MQKNKKVAPSTEQAKDVLELLELEKDIRNCADFLHCDIMDGKFVERTLLTNEELFQLSNNVVLPLDFHLMCDFVLDESKLDFYIGLKPYNISIHIEAFKNHESLLNAIRKIKAAGIKVCLVVKIESDIELVKQFLNEIDMLLIMSVKIGYGGQTFSDLAIKKILRAKEMMIEIKKNVLLQVDGGVTDKISAMLFDMGVDCLVSGSFVFKSENRCEAIAKLKGEN